MSYLRIRAAAVEDAAELLEIYKPYVEHTAITFEYEVPSVEEFKNRIKETLEGYPYIVCEKFTIPMFSGPKTLNAYGPINIGIIKLKIFNNNLKNMFFEIDLFIIPLYLIYNY